MLPPLVLRPPHRPRLVRLLAVILAAMFHLATAGWSLITNGPEGELASAAQEMLARGDWSMGGDSALFHGPLALWLTRLSFALFGVSDFSARLPTALAVVACVWFTLRLAERFGGVWRGFVAALILICTPGMFTLARLLTPAPLTAAFITAAFYCLQCGSQRRASRRRWMLWAWIAWSFAMLAGGWMAAAVPALAILILLLFYPEARLRFRALLSWKGGLALALTVGIMTATGFAPGWSASGPAELAKPAGQFLGWQAGLLFPWSLLLLPAAGCVLMRVLALRRLDWAEAFPLAWLVGGLGIVLADPARTLFSALPLWPAFAVWAALRLETLHRLTFLRWNALISVVTVGVLFLTGRLRPLLALLFPDSAQTFAAIPDFFWPSVTPVAFIAVLAFLLFLATAFWTEFLHSRRFALLALFAAMIPAGFAFADIGAKFAPFFSDAELAGSINVSRAAHPVIYVDASPFDSSSLRFYLSEEYRSGLRACGQTPELKSRWKEPDFLVTRRERLPYWKDNLEGRFSVVFAGEHLLLSARAGNAPSQ